MAKVIVVGGGPSGIMAAISAAKQNHSVTLIERNEFLGKKLKLTGGGRCNITNNRDIEEFFEKIVTNNKFLYSALYTFSNYSLLEYFSEQGLEYKEELDQKVYTKSDKADEVIEVLKNESLEVFTNFPIPIIRRKSLEEEIKANNSLIDIENISFYIDFNIGLLDEVQLKELINNLKIKIENINKTINNIYK